jgi:hypothetical protein
MARARVTQYVVEALVPTDAFSPTTPTGAGVSQYVIEALVGGAGRAMVTQYVVEVLLTESEAQTEPGGGSWPGSTASTRVYGWG